MGVNIKLVNEIMQYLTTTLDTTKIWLVALVTYLAYIIFPNQSYQSVGIALIGAMIIDIITKFYSIIIQNGGVVKALQEKQLSAYKLWVGTQRKLISYLVVLILCGLALRVKEFNSISVIISTLSYTIMFLRESQSAVENLIDAGHTELGWILNILKKQEENLTSIKGKLEKGGGEDERSGKISNS